jgi:hypothetical protein
MRPRPPRKDTNPPPPVPWPNGLGPWARAAFLKPCVTLPSFVSRSRNRGIVILVVPKETSSDGRGYVAIQTGYGTEGFITDATTGQFRDEALTHFRQGDYGGGMQTAPLLSKRLSPLGESGDLGAGPRRVGAIRKLGRARAGRCRISVPPPRADVLRTGGPKRLQGAIPDGFCASSESAPLRTGTVLPVHLAAEPVEDSRTVIAGAPPASRPSSTRRRRGRR